MSKDKITHAQFELPKPQVWPAHPFKNFANHEKLLDYIRNRLEFDRANRDGRITRYAQIDRDVAGWIRLNDEDKKRQLEHQRTGKPMAIQTNLPLSFIHLDDMMTYYAQTFAPNRGMFYHTAGPDESADAEILVKIMNNHAVYGGYYRQLLRSIFSILKYNVGGLASNWATDYAPKLVTTPNGDTEVSMEPAFQGNKIKALDMYNLFFDPAVEPSNLHCDGEWYATVEMKSHYWLKNKCLEGVYFNAEEELDDEMHAGTWEAKYYVDPPAYAKMEQDESSNTQSWYSILKGGDGYLLNGAYELVTMYIRLNPNDFGLVNGTKADKAKRNRYEVWRITLLNDEKIIEATYMKNIHNYLPAFMGSSNDDIMAEASKSPAEILNPLQQFSSFLLNAHILANRKNIFGTTFYDPSCVDYGAIPEGEVAARVPLKPQGYGKDIRTMVQHDSNVLDTKQTLADLQGMLDIINQFFPTQSLPSQIASIDRAVDSQVSAVQQGANRRQHKGGRLIDDTMMRPLRFSLYYNIVQFQQDGAQIIDYYRGTADTVDLSKLRDMNLAYIIGQGLKAIDRQSVASLMQQVIFALIQAPVAAQQIDILKMIDYWTSMMDLDASMEQFRLPPPPPAAQPGQGGAAPTVDAAGNVIQPATAPENLTSPIYGG